MDFKYKSHIEDLISSGINLPFLKEPEDTVGYRFIFKDNPEKNHIPQYINNPRRLLTAIEKKNASTSGYALSCFKKENKAQERFAALAANISQIKKTLGDSLSTGIIRNEDGKITIAEEQSTHFDLYEYCECNLSNTFHYVCDL